MHAIVNMKGVPLPGIMNQKAFDGLPEAARKAIDDMIVSTPQQSKMARLGVRPRLRSACIALSIENGLVKHR